MNETAGARLNPILLTVLLALAYLLLGQVGAMLGTPSPVFPAAGLALAAALWFGHRALPGVWLGAALFNGLPHVWGDDALDPTMAMVAVVIATGAMTQAWAGSWLVNRWQGPAWRELEREQDAVGFLLLGGALAGVASPSVGVSGLLAAGLIERAQVLYTWWTWYVGDVLGILVFAPLTLALLNQQDALWRERRRRIVAPMLLTLSLAALAFYGAARWEQQEQHNRLENDGEAIARQITDRLIVHRVVLLSLAHFIEATPNFIYPQFEHFTRITLRDNPDISALNFSDLVTDEERPAYEQRMSQLSPLGSYQITERDSRQNLTPAAPRPEYAPVRYIVPLAANQPAVGFDNNSEPLRRAAMERARATNSMAVTAPIRLVQEPRQGVVGVLAIQPVADPLTLDSNRRPRLLGFAVAVVRISEMIDIATRGKIPAGLLIHLTDPGAPTGQTRLYRSDAQGAEATAAPPAAAWRTELLMGDRAWDLSVYATASYWQPHRLWMAWAVGVAGIAFAALLQILMLGMTGRAIMIQRKSEALKASEERLRLAVDGARLGTWHWDTVANRVTASDLYCAQFGLAPGTVTTGEQWLARLHPADREATERALRRAIEEHSDYQAEYRIPWPDGAERWLAASGRAYYGDDGALLRVEGVTADITARRQAEEEIHRLNADLERKVAERTAQLAAANAAKGEFLANMSHEIRTPMNAVLGLAQLLEKEPLSPDQRDMAQRISRAGHTLLGILNDILDYSKIEAGQLRIERRPFALPSLLDHLDSLLGSTARGKGLALRLESPAGLAGGLIGDALRLEQILLNLISNAIKFTEQGEIRVRAQPVELTDATVRLRFEVSDTGVGIAPEVLPTLFTPFTQADGSITRRFGGTGLGLSICKRLVELMAGTIGVESQEGAGSTFWFELPFERAAAVVTQPETAAQKAVPVGPRLAGRRVLVVDDSEINQNLVARALQREGAATTLAADGSQALAALRASPQGFDAVLMDVQMPVMDGLTATHAIRDELGLTELPVIAFTAGVLSEERQKALAAGVNDFLPKPVVLEEMATMLLRWMTPRAGTEDVPASALAVVGRAQDVPDRASA